MPPMPHVVTQGHINTALENAFNEGYPDLGGVARSPAQTKLDTLHDLRDGKPIGACGDILAAIVEAHIDLHWFGTDAPSTVDPTGWWINWAGPAQDIARQGMICALEVALGLDPAGDVVSGEDASKDWLIDMSWICPVPRFEFWVSWRDHSSILGSNPRAGAVHLTMATPGYGMFTPPDPNPGGVISDYEPLKTTLSPARTGPYPDHGHIVVGANQTDVDVFELPLPGWSGLFGEDDNDWKIIVGAGARASGPIVIYEPDVTDGIAPDGQPDPGVLQ
ncbi:MAG: hypothetical protein OEV40_29145 [Acidimicrobiia bacterium]|nr:hypothetical protein [Acidimicrobiia bacterium]